MLKLAEASFAKIAIPLILISSLDAHAFRNLTHDCLSAIEFARFQPKIHNEKVAERTRDRRQALYRLMNSSPLSNRFSRDNVKDEARRLEEEQARERERREEEDRDPLDQLVEAMLEETIGVLEFESRARDIAEESAMLRLVAVAEKKGWKPGEIQDFLGRLLDKKEEEIAAREASDAEGEAGATPRGFGSAGRVEDEFLGAEELDFSSPTLEGVGGPQVPKAFTRAMGRISPDAPSDMEVARAVIGKNDTEKFYNLSKLRKGEYVQSQRSEIGTLYWMVDQLNQFFLKYFGKGVSFEAFYEKIIRLSFMNSRGDSRVIERILSLQAQKYVEKLVLSIQLEDFFARERFHIDRLIEDGKSLGLDRQGRSLPFELVTKLRQTEDRIETLKRYKRKLEKGEELEDAVSLLKVDSELEELHYYVWDIQAQISVLATEANLKQLLKKRGDVTPSETSEDVRHETQLIFHWREFEKHRKSSQRALAEFIAESRKLDTLNTFLRGQMNGLTLSIRTTQIEALESRMVKTESFLNHPEILGMFYRVEEPEGGDRKVSIDLGPSARPRDQMIQVKAIGDQWLRHWGEREYAVQSLVNVKYALFNIGQALTYLYLQGNLQGLKRSGSRLSALAGETLNRMTGRVPQKDRSPAPKESGSAEKDPMEEKIESLFDHATGKKMMKRPLLEERYAEVQVYIRNQYVQHGGLPQKIEELLATPPAMKLYEHIAEQINKGTREPYAILLSHEILKAHMKYHLDETSLTMDLAQQLAAWGVLLYAGVFPIFEAMGVEF